ncbi:hypothetical protein TNIN_115501 [Trichonephila inaurata madagascariensis]|uniref:Uncharacterized protein n=1 Tax=Trichonephila inaurata madagascariensis TaxID=2747483 RepID=A0A8X6XEJ7_9ARAC|nr:hypothetical protein TNIN_115501 [Trichonephila inaurata madagascariensis]
MVKNCLQIGPRHRAFASMILQEQVRPLQDVNHRCLIRKESETRFHNCNRDRWCQTFKSRYSRPSNPLKSPSKHPLKRTKGEGCVASDPNRVVNCIHKMPENQADNCKIPVYALVKKRIRKTTRFFEGRQRR